jgi:hypothetical protein
MPKPGTDDEELEETLNTEEDDGRTEEADDDDDDAGIEDEEEGDDGDDDDEGDDGDDEDDEEDFKQLGQRAQKRIKKLVAERKDRDGRIQTLEKELEEAKKLGGDDGKAIVAAAEKSGVLPSLMTAREAKGIADLERAKSTVAYIEDLLDDNKDSYEIGGSTLTQGELRKELRRQRQRVDELDDEFGDVQKDLRKKTRKVLELGIAAMKAGWDPNKKAQPKRVAKSERNKPDGRSRRPVASGGGEIDWGSVSSEADLYRAMSRGKRK